jgi:hypothetical protein
MVSFAVGVMLCGAFSPIIDQSFYYVALYAVRSGIPIHDPQYHAESETDTIESDPICRCDSSEASPEIFDIINDYLSTQCAAMTLDTFPTVSICGSIGETVFCVNTKWPRYGKMHTVSNRCVFDTAEHFMMTIS